MGKIEKNGFLIYPEGVWDELKYHNEQVYLNFSFFIKVTLAIAAGIAALFLSDGDGEMKKSLIKIGINFEFAIAAWSILAMFLHLKSKYVRYHSNKEKFTFGRLLRHEEFLMSLFIIIIVYIMSSGTYSLI